MLHCMPGVTEYSAAEYLQRPGKLAVSSMHLDGASLQPIAAIADCLLQARHARALPKDR